MDGNPPGVRIRSFAEGGYSIIMVDSNLEKDLWLLARIRRGDRSAEEELLAKYTPLVRHIVRKYSAVGLDFDDLVQEGLIGLYNAVEEYKSDTFATKFSSFAYLCVIRRIFNVIRQSNNSKHRALNSAVSLHTPRYGEEGRLLLDDQCSPGHDPEETVVELWMWGKLDQILRTHLSSLEYLVVSKLARGYAMREIEAQLHLPTKTVDNARTRARLKIRKLVDKYGSLLDPTVPTTVRKRLDLSLDLDTAAK